MHTPATPASAAEAPDSASASAFWFDAERGGDRRVLGGRAHRTAEVGVAQNRPNAERERERSDQRHELRHRHVQSADLELRVAVDRLEAAKIRGPDAPG